LGKGEGRVSVSKITLGSVIDFLISDANNMGAAMAPAAADTLYNFFNDTNTCADDYDLILTGDLGSIGKSIMTDLMLEKGYELKSNYDDCGCMIFDSKKQDTHSGGSGCGCSGAVLTGYLLPKLSNGELKNVLFMSTGALMSPTASMQGETIPGVAHLINLKGE
jgi:stage V sporulation protein AD